MAKAPKIEYTPEQAAANRELALLLNKATEIARKAGCQRFQWKFVTGNGNKFESEYRRTWDPEATPYAEPKPAPTVQPLARPAI